MYEGGVPSGLRAELDAAVPGVELVAALTRIDPAELTGDDLAAYVRACARTQSQDTARFLQAIYHLGRAQAERTARCPVLDDYSGDEVSAVLGWSRTMADRKLRLAEDLTDRLPAVGAALWAGHLDEPKAQRFSEWTRDLCEDHARHVCEVLLPEAPECPVGELIERIEKTAIALDPDWATRRQKRAEQNARVILSPTPAGTANLSICDVNPTDGLGMRDRVDTLAAAVRALGVLGPIGALRAKVAGRLLDGSMAGLDDGQVALTLAAEYHHHNPPTDPGPTGPDEGPDDGDGPGPDDGPGPKDEPGPDDGPGPKDEPGPYNGSGPSEEPGPDDGSDEPDDLGPDDGPGPPDEPGPGGPGPDDAGPDDGPRPPGHTGPGDEAGPPDDTGPHRGPGPDDDPAPGDGPGPGARTGSRAQTPGGGAAPGQGVLDLPDLPDHEPPDHEPPDHGAAATVAGPDPGPGRARTGTSEIRLRLSTALGLDQCPGTVPGYGPILADDARTLLHRHHRGEWRIVITDDHGRLQHVLLARRRPRGPTPPAGRSHREPGPAIVELQVPATLLAALHPDQHGSWAGLLTELQHRLAEVAGRPGAPPAQAGDATRRRPRAEIARWVRVRDRHCVAPGCRRPAHHADIDHTRDHARGGATSPWNLGVFDGHHHRAKHHAHWQVHQPAPGRFDIRTRAGVHHTTTPKRILEPLPEPRPAAQPRPLPDDDWPHSPTGEDEGWRERFLRKTSPPTPTRPTTPPPVVPHPDDDPPPF